MPKKISKPGGNRTHAGKMSSPQPLEVAKPPWHATIPGGEPEIFRPAVWKTPTEAGFARQTQENLQSVARQRPITGEISHHR